MSARDGVVYEFGSIRLDSCTRTLGRNGKNVPLPSRVFDMLLLLVERHGEVVSKSELLTRIWPDTHVEESNLPVMISVIRRAIGDDGRNQKHIQTVSKYGYRFIGEVIEIRICDTDTPAVAELPAVPTPATPRQTRFPVVAACVFAGLAALFLGYRPSAGRASAPASRNPTARAEAEMWEQKGRYAWNLQTRAGILQSIEYYQRAIAEDPGYAAAYAGLAEAYVRLPSYSEGPGDEEFGKARSAAMKAVVLDGNLADAHIASGMVSLIVARNFAGGESEFRKATALDPRSSLAEGELALCLIAVGRTDEAVDHARHAKALDPLSIRAATDLGIVLFYGHRYTEAETELEEVLKLDPYSYRTHVNLGKIYLKLERLNDARKVLERAAILSNHDPLADGLMAEAEGLGGDTESARAILASLEKRARTAYVSPVSFAYAYVGLGQLDQTLVYLGKVRANRSIAALYFNVDPTWEALHGKPAFVELVKDIRPAAEPRAADTGS